ncbi:MAG: penicillin-binding protein 2 [Oscillospiraceae bacterium]|jgi:penicillin-binding protein 2|nr:penicillin-binding protein 2 [Oscillospiraceae bacterium]
MWKRTVVVFAVLVSGIVLLSLRLLGVPSLTQAVDLNTGGQSVVIDRSRGSITDCNGLPLVGKDAALFAAAEPSAAAQNVLRSALNNERFEQASERLTKGNVVSVQVDRELPENDVRMATAYPRYGTSPLAVHLIGYLDGDGKQGLTGLEKTYNTLLESHAGSLLARLPSNARGIALGGADIEILSENYGSKAGIQLTIDRNIQEITEKALRNGGIEQGAAIVLDAKTGEIRALASTPAFDPNDIAASLNDPSEPFLNRALLALPVGSTFKPFIAAAALEQGILPGTRFTCTGTYTIGDKVFRCNDEKAHGEVTMPEALAQSCNIYFIQLGQMLEKQGLLDILASFGFGAPLTLADGIASAKGNLPTLQDLRLPGAVANLCFGQGSLLCSPLQLAAATAALCNGGMWIEPTLIKGTTDTAGTLSPLQSTPDARNAVSAETAELLRIMLKGVVENGTGKSAKPENNTAGGKTATAQTGRYDEAGNEILQSGFTGFFPANDPKYVIVIVKQNGASGSRECAPVFKAIADAIEQEE